MASIYEVVWDHIQRHYGNGAPISVDALQKSLVAEKRDHQRGTLISVFDHFEKQGLGRRITGRRNHPTRFQPIGQPKSIQYASPKASNVSTESTTDSRARPTSEIVEYPYPLRPGFFAKLALPADLTSAEAERLASFLQSLPIEAAK